MKRCSRMANPTRRTLARLAFADHMDRPLRFPRRFVKLWSGPEDNPERDLKSFSPLQKHEPPQESSAHHLAKTGRSQFPMFFRADLRCRVLPNQTNHLAR